MKKESFLIPVVCLSLLLHTGCNGQSSNANKQTTATPKNQGAASTQKPAQNFVEGKDYNVFERVRLMDKQGFTQPVEASSMLLPKGWQSQGEIIWIMPG